MRLSDLHRRVSVQQFIPNEFIILVKTDNTGVSASNQILLPIQGSSMVIDWGDGNVSTHTQTGVPNNTIGGNNVTHTYSNAGTYKIKISTTITRIYFNNGGDRLKLLEIQNWGVATWSALGLFQGFLGCSNMDLTAIDIPILQSTNINIGRIFSGCSSLINSNSSLSNWDTSKVIGTVEVFFDCTLFNKDISNWDVGLASNMSGMFFNATSFNQNLSLWQIKINSCNLNGIFRSSGMSCANYTDTIVGWANFVKSNNDLPISINMTNQIGRTFANSRGGGNNFANAQAARTYLTTAPISWIIAVDSIVTNC